MKTAYRSPHILLIDDDEKLCALMRDYLSPQDMEVSIALKGADGLRLAREEHCDLILLDLMLPDMNGLEILRELRRTSSVPIIILSAQDSEADRVAGLEMGSDDYISKPFSPRELLARLRAVLRRIPQTAQGDRTTSSSDGHLTLRGLEVDLDSMEASLDGRLIPLTSYEFRILAEMMKHPGHVFTREYLMDCVAERDLGAFDRSIDMHISSIRRKLGDSPRFPRYLKTIRGTGYILLKKESRREED